MTARTRSPGARAARRAWRSGFCAACGISPLSTDRGPPMPRPPIAALQRLDVDQRGLDAMDRRYLLCIADNYKGGPVGVDTLAAALSEQRDTIEEVIEPYLIQQGFIMRTPRGRMLAEQAYTPPRHSATGGRERSWICWAEISVNKDSFGTLGRQRSRVSRPRLLRGHRRRRHRVLRQLLQVRRKGADGVAEAGRHEPVGAVGRETAWRSRCAIAPRTS